MKRGKKSKLKKLNQLESSFWFSLYVSFFKTCFQKRGNDSGSESEECLSLWNGWGNPFYADTYNIVTTDWEQGLSRFVSGIRTFKSRFNLHYIPKLFRSIFPLLKYLIPERDAESAIKSPEGKKRMNMNKLDICRKDKQREGIRKKIRNGNENQEIMLKIFIDSIK